MARNGRRTYEQAGFTMTGPRISLIDLRAMNLACAFCAQLAVVSFAASTSPRDRPVAPKIWDEKALATWALPVAGVNATPNFYSETEYYATPTGDLRTYPVYHPDREPAGYMDWLRSQEPKPLVDPAEIQSEADWERLGERVFDELDQPRFRTDDPRAIQAFRDREILKTSPLAVSPDGQIVPVLRNENSRSDRHPPGTTTGPSRATSSASISPRTTALI